MQGKNNFTSSEVEIIKSLLRQKSRATKSEQKKIRAKMRDLEFYITDFDQSQSGYTVIDFENLIKNRKIIISNDSLLNTPKNVKSQAKIGSNEIDFNLLRRNYKPDLIKVLYIAESPPAGGTFFYAANSNLFRCIKNAFTKVLGETVGDNCIFLDYFKTNNFYLDDLCLEPINKKSDTKKILLRQQGIEPLSKKIKVYYPDAIIILMKGIESEVKDAINRSDINTKYIFVATFPGFNKANKDNCITDNELILRKLIGLGVIKK